MLQTMAATLEIHFLMLKYTHCQFCQNYPKKVTKIKLILAKLAFATNYEVWCSQTYVGNTRAFSNYFSKKEMNVDVPCE
jgi:hypothetical protein